VAVEDDTIQSPLIQPKEIEELQKLILNDTATDGEMSMGNIVKYNEKNQLVWNQDAVGSDKKILASD
jgi:hypothetical protein